MSFDPASEVFTNFARYSELVSRQACYCALTLPQKPAGRSPRLEGWPLGSLHFLCCPLQTSHFLDECIFKPETGNTISILGVPALPEPHLPTSCPQVRLAESTVGPMPP